MDKISQASRTYGRDVFFARCSRRGLHVAMQRKKTGILILTPFYRPNIGGVESYLHDLSEYLRTHGYAIYVLTYTPLTVNVPVAAFETRPGLEIRRIPWLGCNLFHRLEPYPLLEFIYLTPWLLIRTFFFLIARGREIDVIHAQGLNAAFITRLLAPLFRKKAVMSTCAVYGLNGKNIFSRVVKWTLSGMDRILPLARFSEREILRIGLPAQKLQVYHLWIDQENYIPADKNKTKESLGLTGKFVVLFVGRFIRIKGAEVLLEAAMKTADRATFVFIGDEGPLLSMLEEESRRNARIVLVKNISGLQLVPYYQAADVVVVPSQYDEAFGKVIIEALSCGTPVIGSNRGAIPDIVSETVGRIVEPTVEALAAEITRLLDNPKLLAELSARCRGYALEHFGEGNIKVIMESYA